MKTSILVSIAPMSRGIRTRVDVLQDGICVKTMSTTRLWGQNAQKAPDTLLVQKVAGALAVELRDWMNQGHLPF